MLRSRSAHGEAGAQRLVPRMCRAAQPRWHFLPRQCRARARAAARARARARALATARARAAARARARARSSAARRHALDRHLLPLLLCPREWEPLLLPLLLPPPLHEVKDHVTCLRSQE